MEELRNYVESIIKVEKPNEKTILTRPWALDLYKQVKKISEKNVLKWCHKVICIGETEIATKEWVHIFMEQVTHFFEDLNADIENLELRAIDDIKENLADLEELCNVLQVPVPKVSYKDLNLSDLQDELKRLVDEYKLIANKRRKETTELRNRQLELCNILNKTPLPVMESPLPSAQEIEKIQKYIQELETEKLKREETCLRLRTEILQVATDLEIQPKFDFEKEILTCENIELLLTEEKMTQLENYLDNLMKQANNVRSEIAHLQSKLQQLWDLLEVDQSHRATFQKESVGSLIKLRENLKTEIVYCENWKKQNMMILITKLRNELTELWGKCHCEGQEVNNFQFLYSDAYSDDLLNIHEEEIEKWRKYYEENRELIMLIEKHSSLWRQMLELEGKADGPGRFKNRGGNLLLEERARNKLSKKIPVCEEKLLELASEFEKRKGQPFKTFGRTVEEYLQRLHEEREMEKKMRCSAKKQPTKKMVTPGKMRTGASSSTRITPASAKHLVLSQSNQEEGRDVSKDGVPSGSLSGTQTTAPNSTRVTPVSTKKLPLTQRNQKETGAIRKDANGMIKIKMPLVPCVKVTSHSARRLSLERRQLIKNYRRLSRSLAEKQEDKENEDKINTTDYDEFENLPLAHSSNYGSSFSTIGEESSFK